MNALGGADDEVKRRKQASEEVVKVTDKDQATQKKPRYIWTRDVHNCFLDAIKQLGYKTAVPTKILELMNVEGLTRENVASHLQKYRLQVKRRDQERAQAFCASENVPEAVYPHMSGIPQQPWVLPNTMQGMNMDCACLDGSQLVPSFANHNLNMIQGFPTVHGTPFKDLFDEGVNRMSGVRLVHDLYDNNGPRDINKVVYNYGSLPLKPLVDSYSQNFMDRHATTLIPQYDWRDDLSRLGVGVPCPPEAIGGIIEMKVEGFGVGMPRPATGVLGMKFEGLGLGVPRLPEAPEAIGGLIEMKVEGLGVGMPRPPTGVLGMKFEGLGLGVPRLPEATGIKVEGHATCLPEAKGGFVGLGTGMTYLPEAKGGFVGLGTGMTYLPEAKGGFVGLGTGMTYLPEAKGGFVGLGTGMTHQPGGPGFGVARLTEASGGLPEMNDLEKGFSFELESDFDYNDSWMDMKGDVDGKSQSFDEDLFWRY